MDTTKNPTLFDLGTPWAEVYPGSGRLTGRLSARPEYDQNGLATDRWTCLGFFTEAEFMAEFEWQQHTHCHTQSNADFGCAYCVRNGWVAE